jgi:hypothetical protein
MFGEFIIPRKVSLPASVMLGAVFRITVLVVAMDREVRILRALRTPDRQVEWNQFPALTSAFRQNILRNDSQCPPFLGTYMVRDWVPYHYGDVTGEAALLSSKNRPR